MLIMSGVILFVMDNRRGKVAEGEILQRMVKLPRVSNQNTLMQLEMRYWGVLMVVVGMVWLMG